jgi:tetratricopeptide (TPR) repeat protein
LSVRLARWPVIVTALAVTVGSAWRLEGAVPGREPERELLYLPNGKLLRVASLGFAPLVADVFYLWAIQYYADYERGDRYRWVEHVFDDVITELDPNYIDAYWLGAMILILEAGDLEAGLRLLEKGAERNPREWILLYLAGWESYHAGQSERAQAYFRRAMAVEGAPRALPRLVAGIEARKGNLRVSIRLWQEVLEDPASDERAREIAARQIRELTVKADLAALGAAIERFRREHGVLPRSLAELQRRGFISYVPIDPRGNGYVYDAATGAVASSAARVLGGS